MNDHIEQIKDALMETYSVHANDGILAIYLWGSILSPDYSLGSSDIDTIAIVSDDTPISLEKNIQNELSGKIPGVDKFGFRFLYESELNGGTIKGNLASYIDIKLLLLDFPNWMHVAGTDFKRTDFALPPLTEDEAIGLHLAKAKKLGWTDTASISERDVMYFLKNLSQTIYMKERLKGMTGPFSYSRLEAFASGTEKELIRAINASKKAGWDYETFLNDRLMYQRYLDDIMSK